MSVTVASSTPWRTGWSPITRSPKTCCQQTGSQQLLKLRHHLAEAARALDYTREYSVKLVGHAGAGKSTLLAALLGQDIFPRLAGGAVTGVCTRVRLCSEQELEELRVHFLTRAAFNQEGRDYAGRILSVYPELLKIDSTLPATAVAQDFQKVTAQQHEAMLRYSGLPELTHDLQAFLTSSRYEVQLRQAETQLALALQQLEDLCWENLNQLGVHSRDLQELDQEIKTRQSKRGPTRFEQLQRRTNQMHEAWKDALQQFDSVIRSEQNAFHQALQMAHDRAARRIKIRILQGHFDHSIKVGNHAQDDSPAMEIGNRWVDIDGWNLIKELRTSFSAALERELQEPARTLAEAFLIPIAHKEAKTLFKRTGCIRYNNKGRKASLKDAFRPLRSRSNFGFPLLPPRIMTRVLSH